MQISCPSCEKQLRVPDTAAGKKVKCPGCGNMFVVSPPQEQIQAPPPRVPKAVPPPMREEVEEDDAPRSPRRSRRDDDEDDDDRPRRSGRRDKEEDEDDDDRPARSRRDDDEDDDDEGDSSWRRRRKKNGKGRGRDSGARNSSVTSVGVITIILGSLTLLCGLCVAIGALGLAGGAGGGMRGGANVLPFQAAAGLLVAIAILVLILGVVYLMGGIGVLQRRNWGRIMTLIAAGFSALFGVFMIMSAIGNLINPARVDGKILAVLISFLSAAVFFAHCIMSFIVLLNRQNAREFE